ncbi:MAG: RHS repeat protein [Desulfobacteraceae bacterium]|nr:MAG: RHS repeat protein [Desulfobacteraceae bacterium]
MKKIICTILIFIFWFCFVPGISFGCWGTKSTVKYSFYEDMNTAYKAGQECLGLPGHSSGGPCANLYPGFICVSTCGWVTNWQEAVTPCDVQNICYYSINMPEDLPAYDCGCSKEDPKSGQQCPADTAGDPINILTGNYTGQDTDLSFNTTFEKGFELYRTYRSRVNVNSPFGFSWTHNYNLVLEPFGPPDTRAYQIRDEANQTYYYQDNDGDGLYTGILSTKGSLRKETDGTFTWYRANEIEYRFNASFKLISKKDGKGQVQTLAYDANNRLQSVTDQATGRSIGFVYNTAGRIAQVTGPITPSVPDGIWVYYQYDAAGNLTRVIYADGSGIENRYQDTNDNHNLTEKRTLSGAFIASWQYDSLDRAWKNVTRDGKGVWIMYGGSMVWVYDAWDVKKIYTIQKINGIRRITNVTQTGGCTSCGGDGVRYAYDTQRRVIEKELANGRIDKYQSFDSQSRYQTEIHASGTSSQRTFNYTYHPVSGAKLSITEKSLLSPTYSKQTIYDYDNDANSVPNENPSNLVYRQIEKGYTKDQSGSVVPYESVTLFTYNAKGQP